MSDSPEQEVEATCTEAAYKLYSCTNTGCKDKIKVHYGKPLDHDFGEWEVVTEPTDTEAGVKKHTCKGCGRTETDTIPKKDSAEGGNNAGGSGN